MSKWSFLLVLSALAMAAAFYAGVKVGRSADKAHFEVTQSANAAPVKAEPSIPALPVETPAAVTAPAKAAEDVVAKFYGEAVRIGPRSSKLVALTFDDGPSAAYNARFISTLQQHNATATFFVIGSNVTQNPNLVKNLFDAGLEVGLHSMTHLNPAHASAEQLRNELVTESELVQRITGQKPRLFRPPYGTVTRSGRDIAKELGLVLINWSIDTEDWRAKDPASIHAHVMRQLHPGAIILMHEIKANTIEILPKLIEDIRVQGYEFVTVSRLLEEIANAPATELVGGGAAVEPPPAPQAIPIGEIKTMMNGK